VRVHVQNQIDGLALKAAQIGLWEIFPEPLQFTIDVQCRAILGLSENLSPEITAEDLHSIVHPVDYEHLQKVFCATLSKARDAHAFEFVFRIRCSGQERIISVKGQAVVSDDGQRRLLGALTDVTETKITEQKVFANEERFRTLSEAIPQIVFIRNGEGGPIYLNRKWFEYTGFGLAETIEKKHVESIHEEDLANYVKAWKESLKTAQPFDFEYRLRNRAGSYRWFTERAMPLLDGEGRVSRWFGSITDIDEQKCARESAVLADRMKTSFLANMSHEIRTPLAAILGFTELLAEDALEEGEQRELLRVIARNGQSLSRIVDDILDLSKVEAGALVLEKTIFSPERLLSDIVILFREQARGKGLWLNLEVDKSVRVRAHSDPVRIQQIISNLVSNALKFTAKGGVTVRVSAQDADLLVQVRDTGIGIQAREISKLFQPFSQTDESIARRYSGTGLGLHLSHRMATALGGNLAIEASEPGRGSIFTLQIPVWTNDLMDAPKTIETKWTSVLNNSENMFRGIEILVVDDSRDNQILIERLLARKGAIVQFAANGLSAFQKAMDKHEAGRDFDLILMDLEMPEVDGFQATQNLRDEGLKVPVVALSVHVLDDVRDRCQSVGCDGFLAKPVTPPALYETVQKYCLINSI
jgi:PAS domain S-box-containing protein